MLFTYNVDDLDLSIFKKHSTHYLSNMLSLGLNRLEFCLNLGVFQITILVSTQIDNDCWIQFFLKEQGRPIMFGSDPRFYNLNIFHQVFEDNRDWGFFKSKNPKTTTEQLCNLIEVIARINKIKSFW